MTDQISFLPMLDDAEHPTWLLSGKPGMQNENGVYTENVMKFREGKLSGVNIEVELCAEGSSRTKREHTDAGTRFVAPATIATEPTARSSSRSASTTCSSTA